MTPTPSDLRQMFQLVPAERLHIETEYQRPAKPWLVNRIAKNFDAEMAWPIKVNFRNGKYYIIDGQHRFLGGCKAGVSRFVCQVWAGMTLEEEAKFFCESQSKGSRVNLTAYQIFNARLASQDQQAMNLKSLCDNIGVNIVGKLGKGLDCQAVTCLEDNLQRHGEKILAGSLSILSGAYRNVKNGLEKGNIDGMCWLLHLIDQKKSNFDGDRMVKQLRVIHPHEIARMARQMPRHMTGNNYRQFAAALLQIYKGRYYKDPSRFRDMPSIIETLGLAQEA